MTWKPLPNKNVEENDPLNMRESIREWAKDFSPGDTDAWATLSPKWNSIVGDDVALNSRPHSLRDGVLVIVADDPAWVSHLSYLQSTIASAANDVLGYEAVREVKVRRGS